MTFSLMKVLSRSTTGQSKSPKPSRGHHSQHGHAEHHKHAPLPFLASPVDPEALKWAAKKKRSGEGVGRTMTVAHFEHEAENTDSGLAHRIFRKQHEASTLELFFDLFFVGNLAIFTTKSAHVDAQSLANYVGFFSLLWTTWFHISMYDVRFYVDCVWTRFCKFLAFLILVSFVGLTSLYDAILNETSSRSFQGIAIVMFGARILLFLQYAVVLWYVRVFDKTLVPMLLTMFVYVAAGFGFLATYLMDKDQVSLTGAVGKVHVRAWYGIMVTEAVLIIAISCVFRILSFKHTHLVERIGLITLIIMGEGIIGLVKSTSYAIQGTRVTVWQESGIVAAAVLLIYLIYVLYFDNIDHHRFGTIGQQVWTLLHFPAHVAILLTVEGSTALIIWNACRGAIAWITEDTMPSLVNPTAKFKSATDWLNQLNNTYTEATARYYYKNLPDYYPTFGDDLAKIGKAKAEFATDAWKTEIGPTYEKMKNYFEYFVYQNFAAEGPYYKLKKEKDYGKKVQLYEDGFKFTVIYFYIAAGMLLFVFAFLYWFGRQKKTRTEWISIGVRIFGGMCLPIAIVSPLMEKPGEDSSFRFEFSALLIPIVTFAMLLVIVVDNIVKAISERHFTVIEERRLSRVSSYQSQGGEPSDEERQLTEEESSYEMHRKQSPSGMQHGEPQLVNRGLGLDDDQIPLTKTPNVTFHSETKGGYSEVGQGDVDELPHYRDGQSTEHFRTTSMRRQ